MKNLWIILLLVMLLSAAACQPAGSVSTEKTSIVVTYSILGSIVKDMVGEKAAVTVTMPNGVDMHKWEPSAKDIEAINKADLVVCNGLNLEASLGKTLEAARNNGVKIFTAADHITVRHISHEEEIQTGHTHDSDNAADPHLWMDPLAMKSIVQALSDELTASFQLDVTSQADELIVRLDMLNQQLAETMSVIPQENRKLVTGHESMGYFAQRYNFQLIGVIIPGLTTQAEISARDLASLKTLIEENHVKVIFTELGTSANVAKSISDETGAKIVELNANILPDDGSYFTFMNNIATVITDSLK
jgi:zinc/manganese transport system substrate-binding protein